MAYSTSAPPALISQGIGGGYQNWAYSSTDAGSAVDAANYFTNASSLGMQAGAVVRVLDSDASPLANTLHTVNSVASTGANLTDGVAITATNTD
jgi:hypothetical protein